tara:strand:- start:418 stop:924 length:507 start_codon:yes stop_codon:yes gene_type:complete
MIYFKHVLETDWVRKIDGEECTRESQEVSVHILGDKERLSSMVDDGETMFLIPFTRDQVEQMILAHRSEESLDLEYVLTGQQLEDFTDYCNDWGIGAQDYDIEVMHTITFTSTHTIKAIDEDDARDQINDGGFSYEDVYTTCEADGSEDTHYVEDQDYDIQYVYKSNR